MGKSQIVILGAGFGGLKSAFEINRLLRRHRLSNQYEVTLIDRNSYHTYTPILYEISTTSKETCNYTGLEHIATFDVASLVKNTGIKFLKADIKELDLIGGDVHFSNGAGLKFHHLVIALGAETNYFNISGLKENSIALKTFIDALKIRDKILEIFYSGKTNIQIVIGGAGSAGVELAGEIQEWIGELHKEIRNCESRVTLIEGSPTILPGFDPKIVSLAQKRLRKLGVKIELNEMIERALPNKILLKSQREIPYDILIWAGGVKASSLVAPLPLKIERRGRVEVAGGMECLPQTPDLKLSGKIYGLGDVVCFYDPITGKPMPGVARAAIDQAKIVAGNIIGDILGNTRHKKYAPMNYPYVIPIGGKWAVAKLGPVIIYGFLGWVLKGLVELNYLLSIMPFFTAIKIWLAGLWIFIRNDRLG